MKYPNDFKLHQNFVSYMNNLGSLGYKISDLRWTLQLVAYEGI